MRPRDLPGARAEHVGQLSPTARTRTSPATGTAARPSWPTDRRVGGCRHGAAHRRPRDLRLRGGGRRRHDAIFNSANVVAPDGLVGTYRKLHLGIPLETDRFTPGDALPVFDTDLGPIGISICYDFYQGPELSRILALKGARLLVNPTGRGATAACPRAPGAGHAGAGAREPGRRRVGEPRRCEPRAAEWAGGSVIAAPQFPGFPVTLARAGADEELITADARLRRDRRVVRRAAVARWAAGPQRRVSRLIADELSALAGAVR